jgi:aspartyl aminopeptidase
VAKARPAADPGHDEVLRDLLAFLDESPTPYHAVEAARTRLEAAGFVARHAGDDWRLEPGGSYYATRSGGTIVAFRLGARPPSEAGFRIVGAHTDSPNLRLKPRPGKESAGWLSLDVEVYGSAILATWVDRDLSVAGRVVLSGGAKDPEIRLVRVERPICRIPTLAIHLHREVNEEGLRLDRHRHLSPALALWDGKDPAEAVLRALAAEGGFEASRVEGFDLCVYDVAKATLGGLDGRFVWSGRLDDLAMSHAGLSALVLAAASKAPPAATAVAALFDHEEVGSQSAQGAGGSFLRDVLDRVAAAFPGPGGLPRALANTRLVSADMAHGVHPNYPDRLDPPHAPVVDGGPVIKTNVSQRYATNAETGAAFRRACAAEKVPVQEFVMRADLACGSTIGPICSADLGVPAVDVGNAMLSMHSCREMAGSRDPERMTRVLARFLAAEDD